jgi:hypothetical protein
MNMQQLAKLVTAGVLAMAAAPAMSLARTHHPVQPTSLSATAVSKAHTASSKHSTHMAASTHKSTKLSTHAKHTKLFTHAKHSKLSKSKHSHTALSHKSTKLSSKKKAV